MAEPAIVTVVTDGSDYWSEIFQGDSPQGTFARHVEESRWPSLESARERSPWWPSGDIGERATADDQRRHRAICSWDGCQHRVVRIASLEVSSLPG